MTLPGEKLTIKIFELLENGVGALARPWQIRREGAANADTRREELLALERARQDIIEVRSGRKSFDQHGRLISGPRNEQETGEIEKISMLSERRLKAFDQQMLTHDLEKAINIKQISIYAEEEAEKIADDEVSDDNVEVDWFAQWRNRAQDVSNEQMQRLWAKVLKDEAAQPGRFSIHTLELLSRMSRSDADLLAKLGQFRLDMEIVYSKSLGLMAENGIEFADLLYLNELGLLIGVDGMGGIKRDYERQKSPNVEEYFMIKNNDTVIIINPLDDRMKINIPAYKISKVGQELLSMIDLNGNQKYQKEIIKSFRRDGDKVRTAKIVGRSGDYLRLKDVKLVE